MDWMEHLVTPAQALQRVEPGMSIFLGTGVAEPRTLVRHLMASEAGNLQDLELIQMVSFGDAISFEELRSQKYRLKTFFSGWVASDAITEGRVDLIPTRFSRVPELIASGQVAVDAAFVQITPPDAAGYCSLGMAVDVARHAMERACIRIGEVNRDAPCTFGDTFVHASEFDALVESTEPVICFDRWPVEPVFDEVAANIASVIEDGSCLAFSIGPLYEALPRHLTAKRHLGIHSPFFTDPLMDLVESGAVTNRKKATFRGKSVASYAIGSRELLRWLDRNPLVEFQPVDKVFDPTEIGRHRSFVTILPARKVDLTGRVALHRGKGNVAAGPGEAIDFFNGAELSRGGQTIFGLPSRNREGEPNVILSLEGVASQFNFRESIDLVVTEYGVANLRGRTVRERAQALIEVAHPEDRKGLVEVAKENRILFGDQIFLEDSTHLYPSEVASTQTFGDLKVRVRAIRPSDEDQMRRLFYRFSDKAVYYRYFSPIKTMPHEKMQQYVNVDYREVMSLVGLVGPVGQGQIIAEARFVKHRNRPHADIAFVVDEAYQGRGIATCMLEHLARLARERGIVGFTADVLASNKSMMKVFERAGMKFKATLDQGAYELFIPLDQEKKPGGRHACHG